MTDPDLMSYDEDCLSARVCIICGLEIAASKKAVREMQCECQCHDV